ncbi:DUF4271 domain-containing protein [Arthrospiribacter ruber]|uniref:DUF4271 domain-containing protein n=1 Tax=Arthrospiribacter ruber TaxID=2487934 RepID=A0A951MA46_9BACT|nr:DUF4271 domain-containing protein [Arthrospiribacter ruber]MBW3467741.1 DUF4271 domain-containing protein [Arthrospiribacter ruber]
MIKKYSLLAILVFFNFYTQAFSQVIENYDSRLFENQEKGLLKLNYTSQVTLDLGNFPQSSMRFAVPGGTSVFMNDKLWFYAEGDTVVIERVQDLKDFFGIKSNTDVEFIALSAVNRLSDLSVKKGYFDQLATEDIPNDTDVLDLGKRKSSSFGDFYLSGLVIILFLVAIFKLIFPVVLKFFISPKTLVTGEDFSEAGIFQKFFSIDVIFYLLMLSLLLMLNISLAAYVMEVPIYTKVTAGGLNSLFFYWILGAAAIVLLFILKFIFLKSMVAVFDLGKYEFSHFFYLLRLLSLSLFMVTLIVTYFFINDQSLILEVVRSMSWVFFWVYLVGIAYLFIILVNRVPFKNYHLFAYICTAELIPFLVIAKLIMG